jgi:hypothetical protein
VLKFWGENTSTIKYELFFKWIQKDFELCFMNRELNIEFNLIQLDVFYLYEKEK